MNRGGAVETKTPLKNGGNAGELGRATKSGRKVKRPAHFDDSPDAKKAVPNMALEEISPKRKEIPEVVKKSARKTILKGEPEESSPKGSFAAVLAAAKKTAANILPKQGTHENADQEQTVRSSRKTIAVVSKEESPEPEAIKKSARKTLVKSAVKKPAVEQTPDTPKKEKPELESPKKSVKKPEAEEETPAGPGTSRTGRKIKIPAHLKEFDEVVVPTPKKEVAEKPITAGRKSLAAKKEEAAPKTPGRARSLAPVRKEPEPEEPKVELKTPRRGKSLAPPELDKESDPLAFPLASREVRSPVKAAKSPVKVQKPVEDPLKEDEVIAKAPRRGKSLAPAETIKSPIKEDKPPTKTPSKRGKSLAAPAPSSPERAPKTPKQVAAKANEDSTSTEPMSRSGRKIKPKKYFGEFEEDEPAAVPAPPPIKVASPVKAVAKSSPVAKKELPVKVSSSPIRATVRSSPVTKKESPPKPKASPVKRPLEAAEKLMQLPKKKARLEPKAGAGDEAKKAEDISPNTEERLITKRGVNDHHQGAKKEPADTVAETAQPSTSEAKKDVPEKAGKQPAEEDKPKRGRKTLADSAKPEVEEHKPTDQQQPEKPKRGRKTLSAPAPASSDEEEEEPAPPKAPKTPIARRMTTAMVPPASEDTGSSRSGRKIKPKKFFGEDEPAPATKPKATPVNGAGSTGGRGKRKTLAADMEKASDSDAKGDKPEQVVTVAAAQAEVPKCPSREEILAVVGAADPIDHRKEQPQQEKMEVDAAETAPKEEKEEQETKHDAEPTPMEEEEEEEQLPQESEPEPEPTTTPVVGTEPEQPVADDAPLAAEAEPEEDPEDQIESVEPEDADDDGTADPVVQEQDESTPEQTAREDFQGTSIPQTSPRTAPRMSEEVPESPVPSHEEATVAEPEQVVTEVSEGLEEDSETAGVTEEPDGVPEPEEVTAETSEAAIENSEEESQNNMEQPVEEPAASVPVPEVNQQPAEVSASSSFSEALLVEDESTEPHVSEVPLFNDSKDQQYESVEFLEMSTASTAATEQPLVAEYANGHEQKEQVAQFRLTTPELEDELDNTEAPPMDDIDDEKEDELLEDVPETTDATFSERDRDNESIIVIPDTPKPPKSEFDSDLDLCGKSPVPQSSQIIVGRVELALSPVRKHEMVPTTPRTPDSKPVKTSCSPDKPEDQEQADVPHEIIEISDSPITVLDPNLLQTDGKPGSTTSTPLVAGSKMTAKDRLIQNSRKRSLSASDAELAKKNVTFHSPANSTVLVDTIDERLKKKNESATKPSLGHRKRSMSEHKDAHHQDGPKPSKISKLPNFKSIHQQQFNRMESIEEFHNRKVQRAKDILASSTVKSPAAAALVRSAERPPLQKSASLQHKSPYKFDNGASSSSSSSTFYQHATTKSTVARQLIPKPSSSCSASASASTAESNRKPLSEAERQEKRQKQFQTAFKSNGGGAGGGPGSAGKDNTDGARRVIEQSRHKQSQILKGVRTNKRFELLMKYRDAQE